MKKTLNINLGGMIFHIDEDAFKKLESYLTALRKQFHKTNGGDEILNDVEIRLAELFRERTGPSKEVVNLQDVEEVISIMGKPEDYLQEEETSNSSYEFDPFYKKKMHRDVDNRIIGGVASGLAAYLNIDSIWIRVLFLILLFAGPGIFIYIILWIVIPAARTTTEKLQMRGKPITLSNIETFVKEEGAAVGNAMSEFGGKARSFSSKGSAFLANLFSGIIQIIKLVLKFALKLLGFLLLGLGLVIIFSVVFALFVGINIDGVYIGFDEVNHFIEILSINPNLYNTIMLGLVLLISGPLLLLFYFGMLIVFGLEPLNSNARKGLVLLTIAGIVILFISGAQIAHQFETHDYDITEHPLDTKDGVIVLEVKKDSIEDHLDGTYGNDLNFINRDIIFRDIEIDIRRSDTKHSYLVKRVYSRGNTEAQARINARIPEHYLMVDTGLVIAGGYFTIPDDGQYRAQKIRMILYLAEGDTAYLGDGTGFMFDNVDNVQHYWGSDLPGHYWTMTDRGLFCTDCEESQRIQDRWDAEEADTVKEGNYNEVKIRDGFIEIEEREAWYTEDEPLELALLHSPKSLKDLI